MEITAEQIEQFITQALAIIGAAAALDAILPPKVRGILMILKTILSIIGANVKHARNAEETPILENIRMKRQQRKRKPLGK